MGLALAKTTRLYKQRDEATRFKIAWLGDAALASRKPPNQAIENVCFRFRGRSPLNSRRSHSPAGGWLAQAKTARLSRFSARFGQCRIAGSA
jgi:hypothetical protein